MTQRKKAEVYLEYQNLIESSPVSPQVLWQMASSNDESTINFWRNQWIKQAKANHAIYKPFKDRSLGLLFRKHLNSPVFLVGSGPSLKKNAHLLVGNHGIPIISCLHNFHFLEDLGVKVDYYVNLDAGPVTIDEVTEGGDSTKDYWELTKDRTLLTYIGAHPNLLAKWKGKIYFFNAPVPDDKVKEEINALERFPVMVSSGGNVLGACLYIAKAYFGCYTTIFLGADLSFSYDEKFYSWPTALDGDVGKHSLRVTDIYGIKTRTWQSYLNFKSYFDVICQQIPGEYINCTEGGILGAYDSGNIVAIKQMDLTQCLERFGLTEHLRAQVEDPECKEIKVLF